MGTTGGFYKSGRFGYQVEFGLELILLYYVNKTKPCCYVSYLYPNRHLNLLILVKTNRNLLITLAQKIHATKPNKVVHLYFLYMGVSTTYKVLLVILDELSSFVCIIIARGADQKWSP